MIIPFEISSTLLGLAIGVVTSAVFFAGLAFGMHYALRSPTPLLLLTLSSFARIGLLLAVGWAVASYSGIWAFGGYGMAFVLARLIATTVAKIGPAA
jgi:hypothetical protein